MIKARSSLFFVTYVLCWTFVVAISSYLIASRPNEIVSDRWRDNEMLVQNLIKISMVTSILVGVVGLTLLAVEYAIRKGWEPHFLEVYRPGCHILETKGLPEGKSQVTIRHANGEVQSYEADASEAKEVKIGSLSHLWVIGQYISRIQVVKSDFGSDRLESWERTLLKPNSRPFITWTTIIVSTVASGYLVAYGAFVAFGGSLVIPILGGNEEGKADADLYEGLWVNMMGLFLLLGGIATFAYLAYQWKRGWDETLFDKLSEIRENDSTEEWI